MENKKFTSGMLSDIIEHNRLEVEPKDSVIILTEHNNGFGCCINGKSVNIELLLFFAMLNEEHFYKSVKIALMVADKAKERQSMIDSLDRSITTLENTLDEIISMCQEMQKGPKPRKRNHKK